MTSAIPHSHTHFRHANPWVVMIASPCSHGFERNRTVSTATAIADRLAIAYELLVEIAVRVRALARILGRVDGLYNEFNG